MDDVDDIASWYEGGGASSAGSISNSSRDASSRLRFLLSVLPTLLEGLRGSSTWMDATSCIVLTCGEDEEVDAPLMMDGRDVVVESDERELSLFEAEERYLETDGLGVGLSESVSLGVIGEDYR